MSLPELRDLTTARVGLRRAGISLPTSEALALQLAHARARGAVYSALDVRQLALDLKPLGQDVIEVRSEVPDRPTYLRRPDLGRKLDEKSREVLRRRAGLYDTVFVIADGLSATAVQIHAAPTIEAILRLIGHAEWNLAPFVIAEQSRVALADEIGESLGAALSVIFIGERPGLSSCDSLGIYLAWNPHEGLTDADRNCISNIRAGGLSYEAAARRLAFLMTQARRRRLSGVALKEDSRLLT